MAFCQKCGKEHNDTALFCSGCGNQVQQSQQIQSFQNPSNENNAVIWIQAFVPVIGAFPRL